MTKKKENNMFSCRKATELIEKKKEFDLSIPDRIRLKFHLSMCTACRNFNQQSSSIDLFLNNENFDAISAPKLSDEVKNQIKNKLKNK